MSQVAGVSRALLPEDVTGSAEMNLRRQIYRVVMGYIELPPKDDSRHDTDGVVVIDFIYKCIDQRPQSFIEGDYDVDCDFLEWLLSSCCLIMSRSSQINTNLINCLTKLFQLLFLKDRKLFSHLTAGLFRVIKDIIVVSFLEHGNVQFLPVCLCTFHGSSQKKFSSDLQTGMLHLKSNVEINVLLLSLLTLLNHLLEKVGPFPLELDWNHLILLCKNHNHQIINASLQLIATSLSNDITLPPQILDSLCWLLLELLSHGPCTDYLQSFIFCCDLVFGTIDREVLAPLRFFDQLAVVLLQVTYTGVYKSSAEIFQDCVGHLLYNCWLVGVLPLSKIRYLLHHITDTNSNMKPFVSLLETALLNELAVISKDNESLKFQSIEQPHPAFKKKLKVSAPQYGQGKLSERKYSNSLIKSLCYLMFSCGQKLSQSIESQVALLTNLETLSFILGLVAGCSVKYFETLKFLIETNEYAGILEQLEAVSVKFIYSNIGYKVLKLVYTCLISIGCLMSLGGMFLAQKNQCLYILSNSFSKESITHRKPSSYNEADFLWITEIAEINLDLATRAICALHYVFNGDNLLEVVRKGMVSGVAALKVELIRVLPLVMYELDSNEAISFLNELVNDAASRIWTESMLLQLSKHALLLCYIVTGVKIARSLEWTLSQETFRIDNSDYQHIVETNALINNELLSSTYCKVLNFIIANGEKSKCTLISTLESSIKICSFINHDALFPLLSLMDHEDIEVVSSFGKHSVILFDLWGSYEGDISNHPFLRKLTVLASSSHTRRGKVSVDILGCLGRLENNQVFRHCVILLLEMLLRGNIVIKAAAFNEIKELCRFHRLASGKLPLPLKHQICELLVEILNEKPSMILCTDLKKNFCAEISNVFGYKTVEEFLQSIHDPFISLLVAEGSNHVLQCLTFIAEKFNKTIKELLVANFHYIFSNLICRCSESRRSLSLQFLKTIMPDLDIVFVVRRSKILNQLLLQLYSTPSQVNVGITFLASVQKSPSSMSLSSDVEIADHLEPNLLSILKFFDAKLEIACEHEDHDLGLMAISSLTSLIVLMGSKYITKYRVNVMALLRLCQKFKNLEVCKKACEAWDCFIQSVSIPLLGPLLSEIVVVLTPWVSLFPNIIIKIFTFLFITNKEGLSSYFNEVYMIPDVPFLKDINSVLKDSIISHNMSWEYVLESHLKHLLKGINHQRSDVRSHAVQSLLLHLRKHQTQIQEMVINRDMVHPAIADIITSLVSNLKDADSNLRLKCGECLGLLGAIDPGRISHQTVTTVETIVYFETDKLSEEFAIELIEHLKKVFLASHDAQEQNCCAFAIQEVLSVLNCANADTGQSSEGTHIWNKLPENTQEIISPYLHSKYSPRYPKLESSGDFFKLSHFKNYKDWIQKWAVTLIYRLNRSIAKHLFLPCTLIFKYNIHPAEFLLPHVLLALLCQNDIGIITKIHNEICHILQHCDSIKDIPRDVAETVSLCSQTVFASLDYLQTWVHSKMKLQPTAKSKPMKSINEYGSLNIPIVENFLKSIPKDLLAKAAFQCHAYARALMYFQQFLKSSPGVVQKNLKFLQEIFVGLNDVDGVSGAAAFRSSQPTIQEQILQYQSIGNYRDALLYYQKAIGENPGVKYYEESLHCLMSLGEFQSALTNVKGLLAEKPELSHIFNSYCIEAAWKLGDWNSLEQSVKEEKSPSATWGAGLGKLLLAAKKKDKVVFQAQLQAVRNSIMGPLTAASLELGSYQRGYEHIVRLHMLHEVEDIATQVIFSTESTIVDVLKSWKNRLLPTEESFRTQEPILNLRRTLLSLIDEKQELLSLPIKQETGCLWLKSASVARHSNCMQAAHNLLLHAADYHLPEYCLEHAELISIQGDPHQALLNLQKTIESWTASEEVPLATKAKAMLMVGKLLEKTDYDSQTILKHYKEVIAIDGENEEGHFCLGRYYDRLLTLVEKNPSNYADVLNYTIKHYGDALSYGNRFIYHCLPRALSLWLDYGNNSASKQEKVLLQANLDKITKLMENLVDQLAPYQFLIAFSQIISRVCHHDDNVYATLEKIILILLKQYPQHSLWLMIAVSKSSNSARKNRCKTIINKAKHSFPQWTKVIDDICRLSRCLLDVCSCESESKRTFVKMNDICRELVRLTKSDDFSSVMVPLQSSLTVTLPACQDAPSDHNPFPGVQPSIVSFDDRVDILNSLQRPKKVVILASDGNRYTMMCKPKDDLRKDSRLMEFNTVINKFLIRDPECRQRHLHIRTYAVIPLSEDSGLVEWVDNTTGYRPILQTTYQEKGIYTSGIDVKKLLPKDNDKRNKKVLKDIFVNKILPRHPPVLGEWFMKAFPDPTSWYSSCQSFARTAAVMSIVGYMVGLGDRHGENILIDCTNGDVVHVDFSYLFNKGLTLEVPEIVPFRLTHNMVDAMGVTKYEGTFRISCEMTMKLMRQQRDPLMCVLKTLIHDPLVEWVVKTNRSQSSDKGVKIVSDIDERLQGKTGKTLPLSVKSHVLQLIKEATDIDNLCQMYIGWGPYL